MEIFESKSVISTSVMTSGLACLTWYVPSNRLATSKLLSEDPIFEVARILAGHFPGEVSSPDIN